MSVEAAGRWMVVARDEARGLDAVGVPMPGLNGAVQLVPWYLLDDRPHRPFATPAHAACHVFGPSSPDVVMPLAFWRSRTAVAVLAP